MKSLHTAAFIALAAIASSSMAVEAAAPSEAAKADLPKVFHAGGRHDQVAHEAAVRARANGHRMERTTFHAGGRHDERAHQAAIRADEKRDRESATR